MTSKDGFQHAKCLQTKSARYHLQRLLFASQSLIVRDFGSKNSADKYLSRWC